MLFKEWTGSRQEWKANWLATILFHEFNQKFVNWQTQRLTGKQRRINKLDIYLPGKAKRNCRLIKCEVWGKGKKWELCLCLKLEQLSEPFAKMWTPGVRRGFSGQNKTLLICLDNAKTMPRGNFKLRMAYIRSNHVKLSFLKTKDDRILEILYGWI